MIRTKYLCAVIFLTLISSIYAESSLELTKTPIIPILVDDQKAEITYDTTRVFPPPGATGTLRDIAIGKNFKGSLDDTVRIFTVMSATPRHVLLINDTTHVPPLKVATAGWQRHGANGRWIDSSQVGYHGAAVGDIDGDGVTDMIYGRYSSPARLFRAWWNGSTWQKESLPDNSASKIFAGAITDIAVGDADNDGVDDVIFTAGNAVFRMRWTGSNFTIDSIWGGDGNLCTGIAIGDFDGSFSGNEIAAVTATARLVRIRWTGTEWVSNVLFYSTQLRFYDVAIGNFDPDFPGDEIAVNNGYQYAIYGNILLFKGSGASWDMVQIVSYNSAWWIWGEIAVGNVYDIHDGNEIVATAGQAYGVENQTVMIWKSQDTWFTKFLPKTGGTTYGVAIGNVNKHRPTSTTGIPQTDEIVMTGNDHIYECEQRQMFNKDITIISISYAPTTLVIGDTVTIKTKLVNTGYNTQDTIPLFYITPNKSVVGPETCFTNLTYGDSTDYTFTHKYYTGIPGMISIRCSTALVGDQYPIDDTLTICFQVHDTLSGIKTIGAAGDFTTITAALDKWRNSVITGNVTYILLDASYPSETYPLNCSIPYEYRNGNWNLTIKPLSGITTIITGSDSTAIFKFNGVNQVTVDSLVIQNSSSSGAAVCFINGASYNYIKHSILMSNSVSSTSGVVVFSTGTATQGNNNNSIENCNITRYTISPYNCVYFNGSATPADNQNNVINQCDIYDFSRDGIYFAANALNTMITECDIYTLNNQNSSILQGVDIHDYTVAGTKITKNKIYGFKTSYSTPTLRGIYLWYGSITVPTVITNNFIAIDATNTHQGATIYGIHDDTYPGVMIDIYYNSIYIAGSNLLTNQSSYGYFRGYPSAVNFKNNIIYNNRSQVSGTGKHYAIYCGSTGSGFTSNFNDLYVANSGGNTGQLLGYWNSPCTTLTKWRSISGQDANSISKNPYFINPPDLHIDQNVANVNYKGTPISGITKDIDNQDRHTNHPDIGADEYTPNAPSPFTLISPFNGAINQLFSGSLIWHKSAASEFYVVLLDTLNPPAKKVSSYNEDTIYNYNSLLETKTYYWQIIAYNDTILSKASATSAIWHFTTATLPTAPSNLTLSEVNATGIVLNWSDNSSDESGFLIRSDLSPDGTFPVFDSVGMSVSSYGANSLIPNSHYYWRVSAYNQYGESNFTAKDTWTLAQIPGAPTLSDVGYATIKFYLVPNNNPSSTKFVVKVNDAVKAVKYLHPSGVLVDTIVWATYADFGGTSGLLVTGLLPNKAYTFNAKAQSAINIETSYGPSTTRTTLAPLILPIVESYESSTFPPFGWSQKIIISGETNWTRVTNGSNPQQLPYHGTAEIQYNSYDAAAGAHARLITPPLDLTLESHASLTFYMYHDSVVGDDSIAVEISTNFGTTWSRLDKFNRHATGNAWQKHQVLLNSYCGNVVNIALHAFSGHSNNMFVDSVAVESYEDVMVSEITRPALTEQKRVAFIPQVTVSNNGTQTVNVPTIAEIWVPGIGTNEGFEATVFPPVNWVVYNNDGGAAKWLRNTASPRSGLACASCSSESTSVRNNDWLVSPRYNIQTNDELSFWYRNSGNRDDSLELWISTTNNAVSDFSIMLDAFRIRTSSYTGKIVSLNSYAGQMVYIAFVNRGLNQSTIYIDDITIGSYFAPILNYRDSVLVPNVIPGTFASVEVYFRPCTLMAEGNYQFKSYTTLATDKHPSNNMMIRNFAVEVIPLSLILPPDVSFTNDTTPLFCWSNVAGAGLYHIQIDNNNDFSSPEIDVLTNDLSYQVPDSLSFPDNFYYWRVRVELPIPNDPYSDVWTLTIDTEAPEVPSIVFPNDSVVVNNPSPTFFWNRVQDAVAYNVVVWSVTKDTVANVVTSDTTYTVGSVLDEGLYFWKVRSIDAANNYSDFTTPLVFVIDVTPPAVPSLIWPLNNSIVTSKLQTFVWNSVPEAAQYNLVINTGIDIDVADTIYSIELNRGVYQWQVRSQDSAGNWSEFSPEWTFTVQLDWVQKESMPPAPDVKPGTYIKDGGAMTAVISSDDGDAIYAFYGNKSKFFRKYTPGIPGIWTDCESIPYGYKSTDPTRINKKTPKKGSALCWDGDNTIFATKGNTNEFWAYYIDTDAWVQKAFVPVPKKYKGGTSITFYDGKVYLLAGNQKVIDPTNFYSYNPAADSVSGAPWISLTSAPLTPNNKKWKDGSAITLIGDKIFALKGGDKFNIFCVYNVSAGTWVQIESIPFVHPMLGKKVKVKDGGAITNDGTSIYAIKGGGKQDFWEYDTGTPGHWIPLDTIPRLNKKSVPKTGAALACANSTIWLLKGNKTPEFWQYVTSNNSVAYAVPSTINASTDINTVTINNLEMNVIPNPFTKFTTIRYSVPVSGNVAIKLYNATGSLVKILKDSYLDSGTYTSTLTANNLAKGIYFLKYENNNETNEIKLIIE